MDPTTRQLLAEMHQTMATYAVATSRKPSLSTKTHGKKILRLLNDAKSHIARERRHLPAKATSDHPTILIAEARKALVDLYEINTQPTNAQREARRKEIDDLQTRIKTKLADFDKTPTRDQPITQHPEVRRSTLPTHEQHI